jgi:hypothetical protein
MDLPEDAFLDVWGKPDRTSTISSDEVSQANLSRFGGSFFRGKQTLEVWTYDSRHADLVFDKRKKLIGWKTDRTVDQLSSPDR